MDDKKFIEAQEFPRGVCQMKQRDPGGGMPRDFGFLLKGDVTTLHFMDKYRKSKKYVSVDEMLADGWMVD